MLFVSAEEVVGAGDGEAGELELGLVLELTEADAPEPADPDEGDPEAEPDPERDAELDEEEAEEGALTVVDAPDDEVALAARLPMLDTGVQSEDGGAGCASGVEGSPWWNVEDP